MLTYVLLTIATVALAWVMRPGLELRRDPRGLRAGFRRGVCLFGIFALLFAVSALRVGIGNDYYKYVEFINRITFDSYVPTEWGFNMLVKLCNLLFGPENYIAVFAVIAAATLLIFLAALRNLSADFAVSFFLFMTLGFYFQTLNTIRYYLALAIVLWGLRFLVSRTHTAFDAYSAHSGIRHSAADLLPDYISFIITVLVAALFHKSALLAIPMYLLIIVPLKSRRATITTMTIVTVVSAAVCASALLFRDRYIDLVVLLYPSYANVGPLEGGTSVAGIARCVLALGLGGAALWRASRNPAATAVSPSGFPLQGTALLRVCLIANYYALLLYVFFAFLPQISRLAYFLTVTQLLLVPEALAVFRYYIPRPVLALYAAVFLFGAAYFALFLRQASSDEIGIVPYQTYLFTEPRSYEGTWE